MTKNTENKIPEEMTLMSASKRIWEVCQEIEKKLIPLKKAEIAYDSRYYYLLLTSKMGNAPMREADAHKQLEAEEIFETYHALKLEIRILYNRKECLIEISRNLRSYNINAI